MIAESFTIDGATPTIDTKSLTQFNPFVGQECVLKKCCKKYKKGKRCKKCPD